MNTTFRRTDSLVRQPLLPRWRIRTGGQAAAILVAACVSSLYSIGVAIAAASLLFAGPLSEGLALGAGAALIGTVIALGLTGAMSALPCNISHVQSMSAVVLAMTLSASAAQMQAPAETRVGTALAIIALTSVACSALLALTGALRAGRIGRFFPLEVLSGFVAGSGWLLLTGAMAMTTGQTPELGSWLGLADADRLTHFLPAVGFAVALYVAMRRFRHPMTLLVMLGLGIALFYVWLAASGGSVADAAAANYLPRMEHGVATQLAFPAMLGHVDWATVVESLPGMGSIAVLTLLATFLNISAIEHASGMTADADRELRVAGLVNAAGALAGAPPSNTGLAISMLAVKLGVRRRGAGMLAAATVLGALFFVEAIVAHVPRYVTGGLLLYFGINLLKEWLVDTRRRYSPREWWVVVAIVLMVAIQGFLTAIIAGFLIATVLFAWSYASVPVIRSQTSLDRLPSSHERGAADMELLSDFGCMVSVFRLQGFLFFGTVERLAEPVRRAVRHGREPALGLILDFTAVTRIDTASATALSRLAREVTGRGCRLLLCGMDRGLAGQLRKAGLTGAETAGTLDGALEQMEDMILARFGMRAESRELPPLADADLALLLPMMTPQRYEAGDLIIAAGSESEGLGFLAEGRVGISLPEGGTQSRHVRTAAAGTLLGGIGFTLGIARTADVTARQNCTVYWLTAQKAAWLEANAPSRAAALNRVISRSLARKVSSANRLTDHLRA